MKVLIVNTLWGGHPGGIDRYISQIIRMLHRAGARTAMVYGRRRGEPMERNLPLEGEEALPGLERAPEEKNNRVAERLLTLAAGMQPDVVFVQDIAHAPALSALCRSFPVVSMFHDYRPICLKDTRRDYFARRLCEHPLGWRCLLKGHFIRRPASGSHLPRLASLQEAQRLLNAYQGCHHALTASEFVRSAYLLNGFAPHLITTLPLFTPENGFNPAGSYPREKILLFVGRLTDRYKGADLLLEVMERCRAEIRLHIVGGGRYTARIKSLCAKKELGHRVKLMGWMEGEALQQAYRQAMAVVMPSLWAEPFGLVGLEAMANGTPVVAFDVGGIPQWLRENVTGFLVPWLDTAAMAERIDRLAGNPVLVRQLGLAGHHHVRSEFSESAYLEGLMSAFRLAISRFREERGGSLPS